MQILIVDDNIMDRRSIQFIIEKRLQISPKTAKDGLDAINKIKSTNFDIIITDIVMPNIDGIELVQYLKTNSPDSSVIAITGNNPYYLEIMNKLGVELLLTKPIDPNQLIEMIASISSIKSNSTFVH